MQAGTIAILVRIFNISEFPNQTNALLVDRRRQNFLALWISDESQIGRRNY
jgi:hypothetical protein